MTEDELKEIAEIDENIQFYKDEVAWYKQGLEDAERNLELAKKARVEYIALCEGA